MSCAGRNILLKFIDKINCNKFEWNARHQHVGVVAELNSIENKRFNLEQMYSNWAHNL